MTRGSPGWSSFGSSGPATRWSRPRRPRRGSNRSPSGGIDLIVLDQQLSPGTSGLEFFRQVKAAGHNVPAILVTGMQEENLLVEALRAGRARLRAQDPQLPQPPRADRRPACSTRSAPSASWPSRGSSRASNEERRRELEHEIAQRKRVEQALREAEENLRLMVESVKDFAIFTVDPQGRIVSWNSGAEHLFGYAEPEILGQRARACIFTPEDRAAGVPEQEIATAAARGRATDERWHLRKDGSRFFASGVLTPIFDEENRLRGFTKIARDITERKQRRGGRPRGGRPAQGHRRHGRRRHHHDRRTGDRRVDEPGRRADLRLRPRGGRRPQHRHADARARPRRARRLPRELPPLRRAARSSAPSARSTAAARTARFPDGAGRQRDPAGRPPDLHRHRPRHHRVQARRRGADPAPRRAGGRARPAQHLARQRPGRLRLLRPRAALPPAQPRAGRDQRPADRGPSRPAHAARSCPASRPRSSTPSARCSRPARAS